MSPQNGTVSVAGADLPTPSNVPLKLYVLLPSTKSPPITVPVHAASCALGSGFFSRCCAIYSPAASLAKTGSFPLLRMAIIIFCRMATPTTSRAVCASAGTRWATPCSTASTRSSMAPTPDALVDLVSVLTASSGVLVWCRKSTRPPCRCGSPTATSTLTSVASAAPTVNNVFVGLDAGCATDSFQYIKAGALINF